MCFSGQEVKKKWKNLRDCYAKHLRAEKTRTGQAAKTLNRYKTWPWAQQMSFFSPFLQFASTESNISIPDSVLNSEVDESESILTEEDEGTQQAEVISSHLQPGQESFSRPAYPLSSRIRKRKHGGETSPQPSSSVGQILNYLENRPIENSAYDDVDLLCMGYAKTIKKFSPRRQTVVKFKIAEILMQEELAQQMEDATRAKCHCSTPSPGPSNYDSISPGSSHYTPSPGANLHCSTPSPGPSRSEGCSQYSSESNLPSQSIDLENTTTAASWLQEFGKTL